MFLEFFFFMLTVFSWRHSSEQDKWSIWSLYSAHENGSFFGSLVSTQGLICRVCGRPEFVSIVCYHLECHCPKTHFSLNLNFGTVSLRSFMSSQAEWWFFLCAKHHSLIFILKLPNCLSAELVPLLTGSCAAAWLTVLHILWDRALITSAATAFATACLELCTLATLKWMSFPRTC